MTQTNLLHDRPDLYDHVIPDEAALMGRFVHRLLERYAPGSRVLDVGCGLGREVAYLRGQGYDATGIDASAAMIAWARDHHPESRFLVADQQRFALGEQFDALVCVGSTFLYNYGNADILGALSCFRRHLVDGGVLLLDMRNAAFFLTEEGQRWLRQEHREETELPAGALLGLTRFDITPAEQMLERFYTWMFPDQPPIHEHLRHRLLFPQELRLFLELSGFAVEVMFDEPAPHIGAFAEPEAVRFGETLRGRRLQVVARAAGSGAA